MRYVDVEPTIDVFPTRYSWHIRNTGSDEWISANHFWSSVEDAVKGAQEWADEFNVKIEGAKYLGEDLEVSEKTG